MMEHLKSTPKSINTSSKGSEKVGSVQSKTREGVGRILQAAGVGVLVAAGLSTIPLLTALVGGAYVGSKYYNKKS